MEGILAVQTAGAASISSLQLTNTLVGSAFDILAAKRMRLSRAALNSLGNTVWLLRLHEHKSMRVLL